jgi:hypothetical protein
MFGFKEKNLEENFWKYIFLSFGSLFRELMVSGKNFEKVHLRVNFKNKIGHIPHSTTATLI